MKKILLVIFGIFFLVAIILATVVLTILIDRSNNTSEIVDTDQNINEEGNQEVALSCDIDSTNIDADQPAYEYDFTFPQFTCTDAEVESDLNTFVENAIEAFSNDIEESNDSALRSTGFSDYDVVLNDNNNISVRINYSVHLMGGTGDSGIIAVNYSLENQEFLELSDLFPDTTNFLNKISDYSINALKELFDDVSLNETIESGASADENNFKTFVFDDSSVTIVFGKYQVGPGALGNPEIVIPFSEI